MTDKKPFKKCKVAVLISGRGSNMAALIDATKDKDYPASIALVISNKADAAGLKLAAKAGISTLIIEQIKDGGKAKFEADIQAALEDAGIDIVCLAGFMRVLSADFLSRWQSRIINIHPSLLPLYPGLNTHQRALEAGEKVHGCSVHYVTTEVDAGEVIAQMRVSVNDNDTEQTLSARVLEAEHKLYPKALALIVERIARHSQPYGKQA